MQPQNQEAKRVGIWVRVSTEDQVRGESPEHHDRRAQAYAEARGWKVVQTYRLEGVSGKAIIGHPEAKRMLADIRDGTIDGLVFSKLARLARNTKELLEFAEIFKVCGADLISLDEAIDTSSPAGRLFFTMIAAMAQWEREEISSRVAASIPIRAAMGKPTSGSSPFGYRWVDKRLVPDPDEAPVRALIHELFAEHQRKKAVARILNERGYRTRGGGKFGDTTLRRLLDDPTAKGLHRANYTKRDEHSKSTVPKPESEWVWIPVEPIVSAELWDRCAAILAHQEVSRKPARKVAHLFAGFAQCICGNRMYVFHPSPKYVCTGCRNKIPTGDLEAVYRAQLTNFLVEPSEIAAHEQAAIDAMGERERLIDAAQKELKKIANDSDHLFELYSAGALTKTDFGHRFRPLSERRAQLDEELPRMQAEVDVLRINLVTRTEALGEARALSERWNDLPFEDKRQIIEAITDRIVIGKEDVEITLLHVPSEKAEERHRSGRRPDRR
jgi:site-specific DNA recombinase